MDVRAAEVHGLYAGATIWFVAGALAAAAAIQGAAVFFLAGSAMFVSLGAMSFAAARRRLARLSDGAGD